jgi:hypothetical protein
MNPNQISLATKLIASHLLIGAAGGHTSNDIEKEESDGRLTWDELVKLENALVEMADNLLNKHPRFATIREIIDYAKNTATV